MNYTYDKIIKPFYHFGLLCFITILLQSCKNDTTLKLRYEAIRLDSLAQIEDSLSNYLSAKNYYNSALSIYLKVGDRTNSADIYSNLGFVYANLNQFDSSRIFHHKSLETQKILHDTLSMAASYNNLGYIYQQMNQYALSNSYLDSSLYLLNILHDDSNFVNPLTTKGLNFSFLGQYDKALEIHSNALYLWGKYKDSSILAGVLMNIGYDYYNLKDYSNALNSLARALNISRILEYDAYIGYAQGLISLVLNAQQKYSDAAKYADSALSISLRLGQKQDEGAAYYKLGMIFLNSGYPEKAIDNLNKAAFIFRKLGTPEREGMVYYQMMRAFIKSRKPSTAIIYGKSAVNILQLIRASIKSLDKDLQHDYLRSKENVYRELAELLIKQSRYPEAQQIMNMLKEEEYFEYIRGEAQDTISLNLQAVFSQLENNQSENINNILDSLASYSLEFYQLRTKSLLNDEQNKRYYLLLDRIRRSNEKYNMFLDELEDKLSSSPEQMPKIKDLRETENLVEVLRKLGPRTVAIYTIMEESKLNLILMTGEVNKWKGVSVSSNLLNKDIDLFISQLRDPKQDPVPMAKKMYDLIIRPFEADLKRMNADEILWSLDGKLRYVPISALHNGKNFMVDLYRNIIIIPRNIGWLLDKEHKQWEILGFGVSKPHGEFRSLPSVYDELAGIVKGKHNSTGNGFIPGYVKLDEKFTLNTMLSDLRNPAPIVHVASHFKLAPGDFTNSFLLLGDGSILTMQEFKNLPKVFSGVDLFTLSACNTAMGTSANGGEVENFATLAQRQGAKVILATLWPVQDNSTAELMKHFYRFKYENNKLSIAEALQNAQLFLLNGNIAKSENQSQSSANSLHQKYSHPYYWAPFILIGNSQ
ncbi:MAG: CHAT domain-containing protein [Ignavibacteriales bacterium]|nr:CHAT domain-containing protein [Ignavibacteriales bacterium]